MPTFSQPLIRSLNAILWRCLIICVIQRSVSCKISQAMLGFWCAGRWSRWSKKPRAPFRSRFKFCRWNCWLFCIHPSPADDLCAARLFYRKSPWYLLRFCTSYVSHCRDLSFACLCCFCLEALTFLVRIVGRGYLNLNFSIANCRSRAWRRELPREPPWHCQCQGTCTDLMRMSAICTSHTTTYISAMCVVCASDTYTSIFEGKYYKNIKTNEIIAGD